MDLERERGITIKAQSVTLGFKSVTGELYQLNFIDTPGHVDFSYEVSRSLAACEGALLVVDAAQGVEAQSVANCYTALEQGLEVLPVINKIDLPSADPAKVIHEIEEIIGIPAEDAALVSAKTGLGVPELLEQLVKRIPAPKGDPDGPLQALIIDSWFDNYVGVVSLVRVMNGALHTGEKISVMSTGAVIRSTSSAASRPSPSPANRWKRAKLDSSSPASRKSTAPRSATPSRWKTIPPKSRSRDSNRCSRACLPACSP